MTKLWVGEAVSDSHENELVQGGDAHSGTPHPPQNYFFAVELWLLPDDCVDWGLLPRPVNRPATRLIEAVML
jgi:hypothetical protein